MLHVALYNVVCICRYSRAHRPDKIPLVPKKPSINRRLPDPPTDYDIDMNALRDAIAHKMSRHPQWTLAHIYRTVIEKPELQRRRAAGQVNPHATYVTG